MKGEKNFTTYKANIISVTTFGAIDHISSLLHSIHLSKPLVILDSRVKHISQTAFITTPFLLDVTKQLEELLKDLETQLKKGPVDSIILISDQKGIDIVKFFIYELLNKNKDASQPALPLIIIPTSYTTNTLIDYIGIYSSKEKNITRYHDIRIRPKMVIIDERAVSNSSAREKALSVVALIGGFIDVLNHTPFASYDYFLALQGLNLCKDYGYKAAHSPHDSDSRHNILFASHLLSLIRLERGNGLLETMADTLQKVSKVHYPLLMNILLPYILEIEIKGNKETFNHLATSLGVSSIVEFIHSMMMNLLEPIHPLEVNRLYDIIDEQTSIHVITLEHIKVASKLTFGHVDISIHPSIITEDDIIRYFEAAFWGYSLPKEWI